MFVLDTNIVVAALRSRNGASFALLQMAISGELEVAISVALGLEYEAVLLRETQRAASWASNEDLETVLDALLGAAYLTSPIIHRIRPVLPDPADEMVLECAVESGAEAIVTLNVRDFRASKARFGVEVLSPGELLDRLRRRKGGDA